MTKEKLLTVRWNNYLTLALGIPALVFVITAFRSSIWAEKTGLIGLMVIGALFCPVIEGHTAMRLAWLRKNGMVGEPVSPERRLPLGLIRLVYNVAFWVFLLPFVTKIDYSIGFIMFAIVILLRLSANLYANNILKPEQYESFPFRS